MMKTFLPLAFFMFLLAATPTTYAATSAVQAVVDAAPNRATCVSEVGQLLQSKNISLAEYQQGLTACAAKKYSQTTQTQSGASTKPAASTAVSASGPSGGQFVSLTSIPGLTSGAGSTATFSSAGFATFFNNLYKYLIGLGAVIAVIQIIWSGIEITINRDDVSQLTAEKGKIYNAIFGLVLILSPAVVFSIINPKILDLSISISPLTAPKSTTPGKIGLDQLTCNNHGYSKIAVAPSGKTCTDAQGAGWVPVDAGCCPGLAAGATCCGN